MAEAIVGVAKPVISNGKMVCKVCGDNWDAHSKGSHKFQPLMTEKFPS